MPAPLCSPPPLHATPHDSATSPGGGVGTLSQVCLPASLQQDPSSLVTGKARPSTKAPRVDLAKLRQEPRGLDSLGGSAFASQGCSNKHYRRGWRQLTFTVSGPGGWNARTWSLPSLLGMQTAVSSLGRPSECVCVLTSSSRKDPSHWTRVHPRDFLSPSDQFSCSVVSDSLRPHESQHARPPCPSPSPRVHSNSHPSSY